MTVDEFNKKWGNHLEPGHYGLAINCPEVIDFLDKEFEAETQSNPEFEYSQIKLKWGRTSVYTNSEKNYVWEDAIDSILHTLDNHKNE